MATICTDDPHALESTEQLLRALAAAWMQARGWQGEIELLRGDTIESRREGADGTLLELGAVNGIPLALRLDLAADTDPPAAEWVLLHSHLKTAVWLHTAPGLQAPPDAGEWVLARRSEVEEALHSLSNRLNSLMANAGVLAFAHRGEDPLTRFAQQAAHDSDACAQAVTRLSHALLEIRT